MRISVIKGVARNIAHFALSGSAYGAPERTLGERRSGLEVKVAILAGEPPELPGKAVFMQSASEKLLSILHSVGLSHGDVQYAFAEFYFKGQCRGADKCVVTIKLKDGRSVSGSHLNNTFGR
ncbi:hypothetical protein ACSV5M_08530 [Cellvibrio sp. ARAG 10.3]|uniref:hypothetical protein n=1 Tax=Cellvibrio sp. ARAG 10.3 TaxID=3451358 RepID=UPI003F48CCAF